MPPSAGPRRPLTEALAGLIFNPSCLPHGGHWPQQLTLAPLPRDMPQALGGTGTGHPFLERAGGGTGAPAAPGVAGGSCPSWDTGSLGVLGDGTTWVRSRRVALAFAAGGGHGPDCPPWLLCRRQQPLPGNVLAGGTRASKQTDAAPAVGRRAGSRFPSALSHPDAVEQGGSAAWRPGRAGEGPPTLRQGGKVRPPPKPALSGD